MTLLEALADPRLFAPWFRGESWAAWRTFVAALIGQPLAAEALAIYQRHTGRTAPPTTPAREAWLVAGRRSGKSLIAALVAVFLAALRDYRDVLAAGERGTVMVIAADRKQARVVLHFVRAFLEQTVLASLVARRTRDAIDLTNGITIEVHTASFRTVRGYTLVAVVADEIAFWRDESSASPDVEIVTALRPGLATVPGSLLLAISSPYARRGALWQAYAKHYAKDGDPVLCWKAATLAMNPTVDEQIIEAAYLDDPSAAAAEWGGEFRVDVESFVTREAIDAVVVPGRLELPAVPGTAYIAFADPSGGSSDSMTLAVAHVNADGRAVLDVIRERRPPFSPEDVVIEFAETLRLYGLASVTGDRYAGEWPRERFQVHGITYEIAESPKSDLYRALLPLVNSRQVELLDHAKVLAQLLALERRTARGGRDSIDHGPGAHDDLVNALAGALVLAAQNSGATPMIWALHTGTRPTAPATDEEAHALAERQARWLSGDGGGWKSWN